MGILVNHNHNKRYDMKGKRTSQEERIVPLSEKMNKKKKVREEMVVKDTFIRPTKRNRNSSPSRTEDDEEIEGKGKT